MAGSPQSYNGVYQNPSCYHCADPANNNTPSFVQSITVSVNEIRGRSSVGRVQRSQC